MEKRKHTIFIVVGENVVIRNILDTACTYLLREKLPDARFVVVTTPALRSALERKFGTDGWVVETIAPIPASLLSRVLGALAQYGLITGTNTVMQYRAWEDRQTKIPPFIKKLVGTLITHLPGFVGLLRAFDRRLKPAPAVSALFDTYKPELVFSTILQHALDVQIVRESARRGIRSVGMVRSWDNLTGAGYLRVLPDRFIAQCDYIADMAARYQRIPKADMTIVGIPHYDSYLDTSLLESREAFCARLGIDPAKKIILYGAIGEFLFRNEHEMPALLERCIKNGSIGLPSQAIFRPHPGFPPRQGMQPLSHVVFDADAGFESFAHLINSLHHADVLVTAGSTLIIYAAGFDTPSVSVTFDGQSGATNPWFSVARFYDHFTHLKVLLDKTPGVRLAHTPDELVREINAYLADPARDRAERKKIVEYFAAPLDGRSSARLATAVADMVLPASR